MPLGEGEFRSGGRVWKDGKQVVTTDMEAGSFRSGGRVFTPDGKEVVAVAVEDDALEPGQFRSGGEIFDTEGRRVVVASDEPSRTHDSAGRRILSTAKVSGLTGGGGGAPVVPTRGPNGTTPAPYTPAYNTAVNFTASTTAELETALTLATSGQVIGVTADLDFTTPYTLAEAGDSTTRAQNVLVRSHPLGTRRAIKGSLTVGHSRITFAGFNFQRGTNAVTQGVSVKRERVFFWRCVGDDTLLSQFLFNPNPNSFSEGGWIECVWPHWNLRGGDRAGVYPGGASEVRNLLFKNCYVSPPLTAVLPVITHPTWTWKDGAGTWHTSTNPGHPIDYYADYSNMTTRGINSGSPALTGGQTYTLPALTQSYDYAAASSPTAPGAPAFAVAAWLDKMRTTPLTVEIYLNGTLFATVPLGGNSGDTTTPGVKYGKIRNIEAGRRVWGPNDVVQIIPSSNCTGLHIIAGVDSSSRDASGPNHHGDTFQMFNETGPGFALSFRWINSIVGGPSSNSIVQFNTGAAGEKVWINNWIGVSPSNSWRPGNGVDDIITGHAAISDSGIASIGLPTTNAAKKFATLREHFHGNDFAGRLHIYANTLGAFTANSYGGRADTSTYTPDATNTDRGTDSAQRLPSCPDLATLWPDCPYAGPYGA